MRPAGIREGQVVHPRALSAAPRDAVGIFQEGPLPNRDSWRRAGAERVRHGTLIRCPQQLAAQLERRHDRPATTVLVLSSTVLWRGVGARAIAPPHERENTPGRYLARAPGTS